jgi:uncharacterized protein YqeY
MENILNQIRVIMGVIKNFTEDDKIAWEDENLLAVLTKELLRRSQKPIWRARASIRYLEGT